MYIYIWVVSIHIQPLTKSLVTAHLAPLCVPGSKLLLLGMVIPPLIGNPYTEYINPKVDDHPYHRKIMGV